jgi:glycosyltransferase involved in cell wall biosynthesis
LKPSFLVHSHLRWDFVWQRPQQTFSRIAADHPVVFLEEPLAGGDGPPRLELTNPHPNIIRVVPRLPHALDVDAASALVFDLLHSPANADALAHVLSGPVQWFYSPMTAPAFAGRLDDFAVVYDCMDELANFRFAPPDIADREAFLLARADVVFTGGYQLWEAKSRHHANVHFYGCGVDVAHFGRAREDATTEPEAVRDLPHPRLGYFGVIDERLDYDLVATLADAFPEGTVVMVGPIVKVDPADLPQRPNIVWAGQQQYADLPAWVKSFDVCLMPFALNDATRYINPTKTLEYMAAGKPIVSTAVRDVVRNFTPIVAVADAPDTFVALARDALAAPRPETIEAGIARAADNSWDANVAAMLGHILAAASGTPRGDAVEATA